MKQTDPRYTVIPPASHNVRRGKQIALAGGPIPPRDNNKPDNVIHEMRMGWIVAKSQREQHPEWTDEFIMY